MELEVQQTISIMMKAHAGQKDKAGLPYYAHPIRVMQNLPQNAALSEKLAALLHDVLEDTNLTEQDLRNIGYPEDVIDLVKLLTRPSGMTYSNFIDNIIESNNISAIKVKLADLKDNMDKSRLPKISDKEVRKSIEAMIDGRYKKAKEKLEQKLATLE